MKIRDICFSILAIGCLTGSLFSNASQSSSWIEHWIKGIELAKLGKNREAVKAYSESIACVPADSKSVSLYLYLERGLLSNEVNEYPQAIEDFSRVIDTKDVPKTEKAMALRGRASAYAKLKEKKKWRADTKLADDLSPLITMLHQSSQYSIAKICSGTKVNPNETIDVAKLFKEMNLVDSERDLVLSPTGLIVLRKLARCSSCDTKCSKILQKSHSLVLHKPLKS